MTAPVTSDISRCRQCIVHPPSRPPAPRGPHAARAQRAKTDQLVVIGRFSFDEDNLVKHRPLFETMIIRMLLARRGEAADKRSRPYFALRPPCLIIRSPLGLVLISNHAPFSKYGVGAKIISRGAKIVA